MTKDGKPLTNEEIWGEAEFTKAMDEGTPIKWSEQQSPTHYHGFDICPNCKLEIDRSKGLKIRCPKCNIQIRNLA